jgi:hypothetical protein
MEVLSNIITADTRRELITWFITHPKKKAHLRKLSRIVDKQVNAVSRELYNLADIKFVKTKVSGRKKLFYLNRDFLLLEEFVGLIYKTQGLGKKILTERDNIGEIDIAIITENYIKDTHSNQYDIDLLLVGEIHIPVTSHLIKQTENEIEREIKYTVMSPDEYEFRRKKRDLFIENIINSDAVVLIGRDKL